MDFHPLANIFPLMGGAEFDRFAADIKEHGLKESIWLYDGQIIDGRNRYRACVQAGVAPEFNDYIGTPKSLIPFIISLNLHRRHLNESQRAMVAAKLADMPTHRPTEDNRANLHSSSETAEMLNVSERTVKTARKVQDGGTQELVEFVEAGVIAVSDAAAIVEEPEDVQQELLDAVTSGEVKNLKTAKRKAEIKQQREDIESGANSMPEGVFEVISMDPPWHFENADKFDPDGFRGLTDYPTMTIDELAAIKIPAAKNCVLWLWTTHLHMRHTFTLLDAWGFQEKSILTWSKNRMGIGKWLRSKSEFCILAVKGKPRVDLTNQTTILDAPIREHSRKPDEFYSMVEALCIGRRLDFFSREKREGWEQFGSDLEKFKVAANE